jgi:hypothetical protein
MDVSLSTDLPLEMTIAFCGLGGKLTAKRGFPSLKEEVILPTTLINNWFSNGSQMVPNLGLATKPSPYPGPALMEANILADLA